MAKSDPMLKHTLIAKSARKANRKQGHVVAMVSNFNVQYNFTCASIATQILSSDAYLGYALYPEPDWSRTMTLATVFIGAMLGMLFMGYFGDVAGRGRALRGTLCLSILGALTPAMMMGPPNCAYSIFITGRFILGIGVGGIYPLSAVSAAEGSAEVTGRGHRVSLAFFWQSPGQLAPYLLALVLLGASQSGDHAEWVPQVQFRLLLSLGALPALVVFVASLNQEESEDFRNSRQQGDASALVRLWNEPVQTRWTLLGTAGSWFMYDVVCYGTNVFTPIILKEICMSGKRIHDTCEQTVLQTSWQSCLVALMGIPGCVMAILLIDRIGSKRLNVYGFICLSVNFAAMAIMYMTDARQIHILFALFGSLNFFLSFGPNLGTYVLPAICFPAHVRSSCHGISAFGGKLGAVVGALIFPVLDSSQFGLSAVLCLQVCVCFLGAIVSHVFLKHDWEYLATSERMATTRFIEGRLRSSNSCP